MIELRDSRNARVAQLRAQEVQWIMDLVDLDEHHSDFGNLDAHHLGPAPTAEHQTLTVTFKRPLAPREQQRVKRIYPKVEFDLENPDAAAFKGDSANAFKSAFEVYRSAARGR